MSLKRPAAGGESCKQDSLLSCYFVFPSPAKYSFVSLNHCSGKKEQGNQVGDCHQTVEGFSNAPHQAQICRSTKDGNQRVDHHKRLDDLFGKQELDTACAVQSPAKMLWKKRSSTWQQL